MLRFFAASIALVLLCCWTTTLADQPLSEKAVKEQVEYALNALLKTEDFQKVALLPMDWRRALHPEIQQALLIALEERLKSTKELPLKNYGNTYVEARANDGEMQLSREGYSLRQDVFLENGRCAWAMELLLDCELPAFTEEIAEDKKKLDEHVKLAKQICSRFFEAVAQETPEEQAQNAVDRLLRERDFAIMYQMPSQWRLTFPECVQKKIVVRLLKNLSSTKQLRLGNATGEGMTVPSRARAGKMIWAGHTFTIEQDVFLVNGRCAWAIEALVGFNNYVYFFTEDVAKDKKKLEKQIELFTDKAIEAMDMPKKAVKDAPMTKRKKDTRVDM